MGWLRLVGSLKLQVSFAEYRLFYRALLQKRSIILRSLLIVATPQVYAKTNVYAHVHAHAHCRALSCAHARTHTHSLSIALSLSLTLSLFLALSLSRFSLSHTHTNQFSQGQFYFTSSTALSSLENTGLFCRALLQKRPVILRSLLIVATPEYAPFTTGPWMCCSSFEWDLREAWCKPSLDMLDMLDMLCKSCILYILYTSLYIC